MLSSCSTNDYISTKEYEAQHLIDMGDVYFQQKKYDKGLKAYKSAVIKYNSYESNIYIVARIIKCILKINNNAELGKYSALLRKIRIITEKEKETKSYILGLIELYKKNDDLAVSYFTEAKNYSSKERLELYDCLIKKGRSCRHFFSQ